MTQVRLYHHLKVVVLTKRSSKSFGSLIHFMPVISDDAPASSLYSAGAPASSLFIFIILNSIVPSEMKKKEDASTSPKRSEDAEASSPEKHDVYDTTTTQASQFCSNRLKLTLWLKFLIIILLISEVSFNDLFGHVSTTVYEILSCPYIF